MMRSPPKNENKNYKRGRDTFPQTHTQVQTFEMKENYISIEWKQDAATHLKSNTPVELKKNPNQQNERRKKWAENRSTEERTRVHWIVNSKYLRIENVYGTKGRILTNERL